MIEQAKSCPFCGKPIKDFYELHGHFRGCNTVYNYGKDDERFCDGYWEFNAVKGDKK